MLGEWLGSGLLEGNWEWFPLHSFFFFPFPSLSIVFTCLEGVCHQKTDLSDCNIQADTELLEMGNGHWSQANTQLKNIHTATAPTAAKPFPENN